MRISPSKYIWIYLVTLLAANLTLLLPPANLVRVSGALLLIGLLPGLSWSYRFLGDAPPMLRWLSAAALSYSFTSLAALLLHYLPGPLPVWQLLVAFDGFALLPLLRNRLNSPIRLRRPTLPAALIPLLLVLVIALFLRLANLHYSEFQGDEALAMITAAEALSGHEDALFLRSKGPGEVLLPMALWQLSGVITEMIARLPFTTAAMLAIVTIFLIGRRLADQRVGWLAAGFFAFNGFMVAFGRIVQYQALVAWFSAMTFLLLLHWQASKQDRYIFLAGLCLGAGILAHYDAILILPAAAWLLVQPHVRNSQSTIHNWVRFISVVKRGELGGAGATPQAPRPAALSTHLKHTLRHSSFVIHHSLFILGLLLPTLPFYLPFALDPQANRTGDYVGGRIGSELRNNLPDFFHFNTFYSSFYYIVLTGLLVLTVLLWWVWRGGRLTRLAAGLSAAGVLLVVAAPALLAGPPNLSLLPFALLLLLAFAVLFSPERNPNRQALIIWLAAPFLGYNFVVALGLTHIYTIVPAWALLAALGWRQLETQLAPHSHLGANIVLAGLLLLAIPFLWNAFVRHDIEYLQDYPAGNLPLYWSPYPEPPAAGFFGFAHRAGWKSIGQQIAAGQLVGDYGSNEEPDVTTWYTRGAPRACDPRPEFYFLADDLIDPVAVPEDILQADYTTVGQVILPNQKQMQIMQLKPETLALGALDDAALTHQFDVAARPAAFARSGRGLRRAAVNFDNLIQLIGYDLDTRRAHPGGRVPVTLYWQALAPIPTSYQIFTHLESDSGPVAQADGVPVCWSYPTDTWRPGQIIADQHAIALSPEVASGRYPLEIGVYLPDTFERLNVLDELGNPAGTSITLATVEIKPGVP